VKLTALLGAGTLAAASRSRRDQRRKAPGPV